MTVLAAENTFKYEYIENLTPQIKFFLKMLYLATRMLNVIIAVAYTWVSK